MNEDTCCQMLMVKTILDFKTKLVIIFLSFLLFLPVMPLQAQTANFELSFKSSYPGSFARSSTAVWHYRKPGELTFP